MAFAVSAKRIVEPAELLVFGYSCKLFRDDEKALYIDQGKHLIPWMGDENHKIDRYDARGTLFDLRQAEAPPGGFDRMMGLTETEKRVELLCDEERYKSLHTNDEDEILYQEEELKRLEDAVNGSTYKEVEYSYESRENGESSSPQPESEENSCSPFKPSPLLDIPLNMPLPDSNKQNAVIEKTAAFICNQGPQMEILLKIKQSSNPLFAFLSYDNPLHAYYRLLVQNMKTGRYKHEPEDTNGDDTDDHYLHPSLAPSLAKVESKRCNVDNSYSTIVQTPSVPSLNYKPSENCAYSMLVNKLRDKAQMNLREDVEDRSNTPPVDNGDSSNDARENSQSRALKEFDLPETNMRVIIDKMASYVAKNGRDFEMIVKSKNDKRFEFLNPSNIYHGYYKTKLEQYIDMEDDEINQCKDTKELKRKTDDDTKPKVTPVCFSIKTKEADPLIERSSFPCDDSSDDDSKKGEGSRKKRKESTKDNKRLKLAIIKMDKTPKPIVNDVKINEEPVSGSDMNVQEEVDEEILAGTVIIDAVTDGLDETVGFGKINSLVKDKELQQDRKRRVAEFLQGLKKNGFNNTHAKNEVVDLSYDSDVISLPDKDDEMAISPLRLEITHKKTSRSDSERNRHGGVPTRASLDDHSRRHKESRRERRKRKKSHKHSSAKKQKKHKKSHSRSSSEKH